MRRFTYKSTRVSGELLEDPKGNLIILEQVQPVLAAALELELYGATISRLQKLGEELRRIGL
jgi:hypothetical protein